MPVEPPPPRDASDATTQLVDRLQRLFRSHADGVYTIGLRMLGDHAMAEDVVQDTFVKAYANLSRLREPAAARGWLYRIAHRSSIDELRRRRDVPTDPDALPHRPTDDEQGPERTALRADLRRRLQAAVSALSDTERGAFVLRDVQGLSVSEAAEVLSCSESAVKMRTHRARLTLQNRLGGDVDDL